jgi:hypothetical protein
MRGIVEADPTIKTFIRYNPDTFSGENVSDKFRHDTLLGVIEMLKNVELQKPCVVKLFYDGYTHPPKFTQL